MARLKTNTAVTIALGPFVDETDARTAETALTIAQADVRLKKNGGAWAQKNQASSVIGITPMAMPMRPPTMQIMRASSRNCSSTSRWRAPIPTTGRRSALWMHCRTWGCYSPHW